MTEEYRNRDKRDVLEDMRVVWKEDKTVNRFHQWFIVLCHGDLEVKELYTVELWVKFMTEYPDTAYFTIKNSPINIAKNANFPLEIKEKASLTTKATLYKKYQ